MAEKPPAMKSRSAAELRAEFDATRARIAAQVDEIEARVRRPFAGIVGETSSSDLRDSPGSLDLVRLLSGLKGSTAIALVGAVAGFAAMRRWSAQRLGKPDG